MVRPAGYKGQAETAGARQRVRESERGGLFPERNIDLIIFSTRPLALAPFSQRERLSDIDRGEDTG